MQSRLIPRMKVISLRSHGDIDEFYAVHEFVAFRLNDTARNDFCQHFHGINFF